MIGAGEAAEGGRRVHRAIFIGGDDQAELLGRVRDLLALHRAQGRWGEEVATFAGFAILTVVRLIKAEPEL